MSCALGVLCLALASEAAAQAPPPRASAVTTVEGVTVRARKATTVEGIDVKGGWCPEHGRGQPVGRPRIVATYPRQGEVVSPGPITISLTFDQPMNCGWSMAYDSRRERCTQLGFWDVPARRTWTMACEFGPEREIEIDYGDVKGNGFNALAGPLAIPLTLTFRTGPVGSPRAARAAQDVGPPATPRTGVLECPEEPESGPEAKCLYRADPPTGAEPPP